VLGVARLGSFTKTAIELGFSQPGLSRQIQRVEKCYGFKIFDRRSKGANLTPKGQLVTEAFTEALIAVARSVKAAKHLSWHDGLEMLARPWLDCDVVRHKQPWFPVEHRQPVALSRCDGLRRKQRACGHLHVKLQSWLPSLRFATFVTQSFWPNFRPVPGITHTLASLGATHGMCRFHNWILIPTTETSNEKTVLSELSARPGM